MQRNRIKIFIIGVICLLFILSNFVVFTNLHYHQLENGNFVFHGHPFEKRNDTQAPVNSHSHSVFEFLQYFFLQNSETIILFLLGFLILRKLIEFLFDNLNNEISRLK